MVIAVGASTNTSDTFHLKFLEGNFAILVEAPDLTCVKEHSVKSMGICMYAGKGKGSC